MTSAPRGARRSTTAERLPRAKKPAGSNGGGSGRSTEMTSAPQSASSIEQKGPGPSALRSRTRTPRSGPFRLSPESGPGTGAGESGTGATYTGQPLPLNNPTLYGNFVVSGYTQKV